MPEKYPPGGLRATASRSAADDIYGEHDPIPVPQASEHLSDTTWDLWENLQNQDQMRFADTAPVTLPGALTVHPEPPELTTRKVTDARPLSVAFVMLEAARDDRVCPKAPAWLRLYNALPKSESVLGGEKLSPPLDAKAISALPAMPKRLCLLEYVEWAAARGSLEQVYDYFKSLPETDWHHLGE